MEYCIFELVYVTNFSLKWQFWVFEPDLPKKGVSGLNRKSEQCHWILHIRISLGTKFHIKLTISIFWTKFAQKGFFPFKAEKLNSTMEYCILELVYATKLSLNWQFWFFEPNLPKKGVSGLKQKKWIPPFNSAFAN